MTTSTTQKESSTPPDEVLSVITNDHRRAVLRALDHADEKGGMTHLWCCTYVG